MIKLLTRQKFQQQNFITSPSSHPAKQRGTKQEHNDKEGKPESERRKKRHRKGKGDWSKDQKKRADRRKTFSQKKRKEGQKERQKSGRNDTIPQSLLVLAC